MSTLTPLETLYDVEQGGDLPLPPELAALYGRLQLPLHHGRPSVIGNFVTTLDGVASLNVPGQSGGGPISGFNQHDRIREHPGSRGLSALLRVHKRITSPGRRVPSGCRPSSL